MPRTLVSTSLLALTVCLIALNGQAVMGAATPNAPASLYASGVAVNQISLTWADNSSNELGFRVQQATNSAGPFAQVYVAKAGSTSYTKSGLAASTTYYYRVCAYNTSGNSTFTNIASAATKRPAPPAAPTGLSATAVRSNQIDLAWTDNSTNELGFRVQQATSPTGPFSQVYIAPAGGTSYSKSGLNASTTYYYQVCAYNKGGNSTYTNTASATTIGTSTAPTVPTAPTSLSASAISTSQIDLTWTDTSSNETGFAVERSSASSGPFTQITAVGPGATVYTNSGLTASTTYYCRVRAYNSSGNSAYSNTASATTQSTAPPGGSSNISIISAAAQVGKYGLFECRFNLNTSATNYSWPYVTSAPTSIPTGTGVTVDATFTNTSTGRVMKVPCFYFQDYTRSLKAGSGTAYSDEAVSPTGGACWMARFAPPETGTWTYKINAVDSSGSSVYPTSGTLSFNCVASISKGFVGVSATDSRYFELSDGTPLVSPGVNAHMHSTYEADSMLNKFGSNGVRIVRWWMNYREWQNPFGGGDEPNMGGPQWNFTLRLSTAGGAKPEDRYSAMVQPGQETSQTVYLTGGTNYQFRGYIQTSGVSGGSGVIPYVGSANGTAVTGTTAWKAFSVSFTPSSSGFYSAGVRNSATSGTGLFDDVSLVGKLPSDTQWSGNYLSKGDFDYQNYMDPREAWKVDQVFRTAQEKGVYLKTVISEKQDVSLGRIYSNGTIGSQTDDNFYAYEGHPSRWLQKAWWRYIIARWGAYTSAHSWELCNEGDPFSGSHHDAADALASYMHANDPYGHMVTTSFWHSAPMDFWKNSQCDYMDMHEYFGPVTTGTGSHGARFYAWDDPLQSAGNTNLGLMNWPEGQELLDTSDKHTGSRSYRIIARGGATNIGDVNTTDGSSYHVGIDPTHTYTITCWARGSNITNLGGSLAWQKPRVNIVWSANYHENDWIAESNMDLNLGTYGWTKFTMTGIRPPTNANTANIAINCTRGGSGAGDGSLWIDDIAFTDETTGDNLYVDGGFEGDRLDYDTALTAIKYGQLTNSYGKRIGKPAMMGETGIRGLNVFGTPYKGMIYTEENQQVVDDTSGVNLRKLVWGHAGPGIPYMLLWWSECIDKNNTWKYFKAYDTFMSQIPVSNGKFRDARAVSSNPAIRAIGQKNATDSVTYLWIDNTAYNWKNVVDGRAPAPVSGSVTVPGMPDGTYTVEWWDTTTGTMVSSSLVSCSGGNLTVTVSGLVSDVACLAYK